MRLRWFILGLLAGLAIARADGRTTWRALRDRLAGAIDAALRLGTDASC
jgi:hypothetical protein